MERVDIAIVGAGAAGLAAAIFAGEAARGTGCRIVALDGARKLGAKIIVSGGGRCNVTNVDVRPEDYWGGPRPVIRNVLRAFDHRRTLEWMKSLGVALKLEPTGKYFPATDSARTVLEALVRRVGEVGVELRPGARVKDVRRADTGFEIQFADAPPLAARRLVMAMGGLSLPKSGSDGAGLAMARRLGHAIVPTTPALVPLLLGRMPGAGGHFADWSGITIDARLAVREANGKIREERQGSLLFTHFGISGPAALDLSRHWLRARLENPAGEAGVTLGHPDFANEEAARAWLDVQAREHPTRQAATALQSLWPERLAREMAGTGATLGQLPKAERRRLARELAALALNVTGDRGYSFAETTAGGVDLREIDYRTMESRKAPGLFLCGEMLDVDGRIGGFNFQWAWASGYLAGRGAAATLAG